MNLNQVKTYVSGVLKGWISNKGTLDKLSESTDGNLLFDGQEIKGSSGSDITISEEANNAIQQKDDGIFVEDLSNKVNALNIAQKTINEDLDYCFVGFWNNTNSEVHATCTRGAAIPFNTKFEGNLDFNSTNKAIKLKAGHRYKLHYQCKQTGMTVNANHMERFYNETTSEWLKMACNCDTGDETHTMEEIYVPTVDCEVSVRNCWCSVASFSMRVNCVNTNPDGPGLKTIDCESAFIVTEIGKTVTIDPVEYVNTSQGIEDAPVGHIISHMGNTAPKHYLICDGTEYNISDYPYLAQHFIDEFGSYNYFGGDGINTFCVPDLRGEFLRGTGTAIRDTGSGANVGEHQNATYVNNFAIPYGFNGDESIYIQSLVSGNTDYDGGNFDTSLAAGTVRLRYGSSGTSTTYAAETGGTVRPTNTSVLYCIKYEPTYYMAFDNYIAQGYEKYSEEEIIIGKWINGKPLYRKYFNFTTGSKSGNQYIMDIPNYSDIERITNIYGTYFHINSSGLKIYSSINMRDQIQTWIEKGKIAVCTLSLYYNSDVHMFIEYTKTTDAENSFTIDMLDTIILNNNEEEITEEQITEAINIDKTKIQ